MYCGAVLYTNVVVCESSPTRIQMYSTHETTADATHAASKVLGYITSKRLAVQPCASTSSSSRNTVDARISHSEAMMGKKISCSPVSVKMIQSAKWKMTANSCSPIVAVSSLIT